MAEPNEAGVVEQPFEEHGVPFPTALLPIELPAFIARTATPPSAQIVVNTLRALDPEPIVDPPVRLWLQTDPVWRVLPLRPEGQRGNAGGDHWGGHGCHPTCLATILRWWAEDNVKDNTAEKLIYPFATADAKPSVKRPDHAFARVPGEPPGLTPLEMCRRLFGQPFAPMVGRAPSVSNDLLQQRRVMTQVAWSAGPRLPFPIGLFGVSIVADIAARMRLFSFNIGGLATSERRRALKFLLQWGPLIVGLKVPSHFVMVVGYRANELHVLDPGPAIAGHWSGDGIRNERRGLDQGGRPMGTLMKFDTSKTLTVRASNTAEPKSQQFLDNIFDVLLFLFDPTNNHPQWSKS